VRLGQSFPDRIRVLAATLATSRSPSTESNNHPPYRLTLPAVKAALLPPGLVHIFRHVLVMATPFKTTSHRFRSFCQTNNDLPTSPSMDTRSGHILDNFDTITNQANGSHAVSSDTKLQCCCGRPECAYLENNNTLLGGIERDLETAARLGQVRAHPGRSRISVGKHSRSSVRDWCSPLSSWCLLLRGKQWNVLLVLFTFPAFNLRSFRHFCPR
jgi:hypothetical protein